MGEIEAIIQSHERARPVGLHAHPRVIVLLLVLLILQKCLPGLRPGRLPAVTRQR